MPPSTPEGTELVRKVAYHFEEIFTDDEDVIMFFTNNLEHFEDEFEEEGKQSEEKEHKMIYTDLYSEFEKLMEEKISDVAEKLGFDDATEFFSTLQETLNEKEGYEQGEREQATFDAVVASYDYEKFVALMRGKAKGKMAMARAFGAA
ncbi:hypothetical protein TrLO_g7459 [Triparma laevis f. longispina]|uniref:BART domain-containing protein n=2 Tax=Triparma laevis TaxID=1534972 RepID=A0A9W7DQ72_9STRA|nr:hypothetical protein TrLO_g7459 [Triparma laevis f. longispina]